MQNSGQHTQQWISWRNVGIRSRLRKGGRFGWLFLQVVPWLDAIFVAGLAAALTRQITISPSFQF